MRRETRFHFWLHRICRYTHVTVDYPSYSYSPLTCRLLGVGCAVVTQNDAFLFTDGRYFLQAEKQLDKYDLSASAA